VNIVVNNDVEALLDGVVLLHLFRGELLRHCGDSVAGRRLRFRRMSSVEWIAC
jgi:hypothetical protein